MTTSGELTPETGRSAASRGGSPRARLLAVLALSGLVLVAGTAWSLGLGPLAAVGRGDAAGGAPGHEGHGWSASAGAAPAVLGDDLAAGRPAVQRLAHGDDALTVAVGPALPGTNLVRVDVATGDDGHEGHGGHGAAHESSADDEPAPVLVGSGSAEPVEARARPGTEGLWAEVELPEDRGEVVVEHDGHRTAFPVVTGARDAATASPAWAGADGPECLAAAVSATVAGSRPAAGSCPSDALAPEDAESLAGTVRLLAERGVEQLVLRGDDTARSATAQDVVRRTALAAEVDVVATDPPPGADRRVALLDLSGWQGAADELATESGLPREQQPIRSDGTWLAPWLLSPGVVDATPGAVLPLGFDIRDDEARRYAETLAAVLPAVAPTGSGYQAWAEARDAPAQQVLLYAASRADFMSSDLGHPGHETQVGWFPGGTITPVATLDDTRDRAQPARG